MPYIWLIATPVFIKNAFGLRTQTPAKTRCKLIKKVTASIAISALVTEENISLRVYTMMCAVSNSFVWIDYRHSFDSHRFTQICGGLCKPENGIIEFTSTSQIPQRLSIPKNACRKSDKLFET